MRIENNVLSGVRAEFGMGQPRPTNLGPTLFLAIFMMKLCLISPKTALATPAAGYIEWVSVLIIRTPKCVVFEKLPEPHVSGKHLKKFSVAKVYPRMIPML